LSALRGLLRIFSYSFHGLLVTFLLAVSGLALSSGAGKLSFRMLPWTGDTLIFVLFFGSLFGLLTLILALGGKTSALFFLWCLAVAVLLAKGYVFSWYHFAPGEIGVAAGLLLGSWMAVAGAWPRPRWRGGR
jgi:hypothetical protein